MNRRDLLRQILVYTSSGAGLVLGCGCRGLYRYDLTEGRLRAGQQPGSVKDKLVGPVPPTRGTQESPSALNKPPEPTPGTQTKLPPADLMADRRALRPLTEAERHKMHHFDQNHPGDIFVSRDKRPVLESTFKKLVGVRRKIGFGNFNLIGFDEAVRIAERGGRGLTPFTAEEKAFMEEVFYFDAVHYGFHGRRLVAKLTATIAPGDVKKIAGSGHYIYREGSLPVYDRMLKDVGPSLVLTSGARSVVKQMYLFFEHVLTVGGNLSRTSRSLAPPAYSYHSVGDFDVGKRGLGSLNFTDKFSETKEYQRLTELGYIDIRYPFENPFGVRFEPWHILGVDRSA